jgi:hypothetical protein
LQIDGHGLSNKGSPAELHAGAQEVERTQAPLLFEGAAAARSGSATELKPGRILLA